MDVISAITAKCRHHFFLRFAFCSLRLQHNASRLDFHRHRIIFIVRREGYAGERLPKIFRADFRRKPEIFRQNHFPIRERARKFSRKKTVFADRKTYLIAGIADFNRAVGIAPDFAVKQILKLHEGFFRDEQIQF